MLSEGLVLEFTDHRLRGTIFLRHTFIPLFVFMYTASIVPITSPCFLLFTNVMRDARVPFENIRESYQQASNCYVSWHESSKDK